MIERSRFDRWATTSRSFDWIMLGVGCVEAAVFIGSVVTVLASIGYCIWVFAMGEV
jgi:hypothetical protein